MQMKIEINETPKSFVVNGVAIAKRHLRNIFEGDDIKDETRLNMLLTTVPSTYLSGAAEMIIAIGEKVKDRKRGTDSPGYAAKKVLRLWGALKLTPGIADAFTQAAREMAGPEAEKYAKRKGAEIKEKLTELAEKHGKADFVGDSDGNNVIQFPKKPTLH